MQLPNEAPATVFEAFARAAARHGDKPFLAVLPETAQAYGIAAGEISYGAALARIKVLSEAYRAKGYGAGHRVGILMENRPGFFLHWFALNALGVSLVPINPDMRAAELEYLIGHSEIVAAVVIPHAIAPMSPRRRRRSDATFPLSDRMTSRRRSTHRRRGQVRPIATANAPCSTPQAPPAGQKAAYCRTNIFSTPAIGTPRSAA